MKRTFTIEDVDPSDYRFYVEKPDADFSPERNQAIIQEVIDSGMKIDAVLKKAGLKDMQNRVDILSSFARNSIGKGSQKTLEQYVGKQGMAEIYGEKILEKIKIMESIERLNKSNGNTMMGGKFFLT